MSNKLSRWSTAEAYSVPCQTFKIVFSKKKSSILDVLQAFEYASEDYFLLVKGTALQNTLPFPHRFKVEYTWCVCREFQTNHKLSSLFKQGQLIEIQKEHGYEKFIFFYFL